MSSSRVHQVARGIILFLQRYMLCVHQVSIKSPSRAIIRAHQELIKSPSTFGHKHYWNYFGPRSGRCLVCPKRRMVVHFFATFPESKKNILITTATATLLPAPTENVLYCSLPIFRLRFLWLHSPQFPPKAVNTLGASPHFHIVLHVLCVMLRFPRGPNAPAVPFPTSFHANRYSPSYIQFSLILFFCDRVPIIRGPMRSL